MNQLSKQFKRDTKAFSLTLILYLPLLFWWSQSKVELFPEKVSTPLVLDLQKFVCKEEPTPEPFLEEPIIEDDFFEDLEEIMQEPIVPLPPQPLTTKPKPTLEKKKEVQKKVKPKPKKVHKKTKTKTKSKKRVQRKTNKSSHSVASKAKTNQFITKLKRAINHNKIYPKMAKKRGLQGTVTVSFTINSAGEVRNITIKGSKIFRKATKRAILQAFPINTKNISLPLKVNLRLNYKLNKS